MDRLFLSNSNIYLKYILLRCETLIKKKINFGLLCELF